MLATLRPRSRSVEPGRHKVVVEDLTRWTAGVTKELHRPSPPGQQRGSVQPAGGTITVRFAREGDGVVLAVEDTVTALPAAHCAHHERSIASPPAVRVESGGTAGLAIVKHVLQLHQARLSMTSEVGRRSPSRPFRRGARGGARPAPRDNGRRG
jgi:two-component system phosphate regulon sensor histidine kinase PhoR